MITKYYVFKKSEIADIVPTYWKLYYSIIIVKNKLYHKASQKLYLYTLKKEKNRNVYTFNIKYCSIIIL